MALRFLVTVAWRNLWRHARRSAITVAAMAVAASLCMASIALNDGVYAQLFRVMVEQQLGHAVAQHPDYPSTKRLFDTLPGAEALMEGIDAVDGTHAVSGRLHGFVLLGGEDTSSGAQLVGIVPSREREVSPVSERMRAGEYLTDDGAGHLIIGSGLAERIGVEVGDEVVAVTQSADGSMGNAVFTVKGVYKSGSVAMDNGGAFVRLADLQDLLVLPDQVHTLTMLADDPDQIEPFVARVREVVPAGTQTEPWWVTSPQTAEMLSMQVVAKVMLLGIVFTVAAFGVVNTMTMSVFERTTELGVLRALGLRPGRLVALVVVESLLLAAVAATAALVVGGALDAYLVVYGLDFSSAAEEGFSFAGVQIDPVMRGVVRADSIVLVLVSILLVSVVASLAPEARAARLRPVEAIRSE